MMTFQPTNETVSSINTKATYPNRFRRIVIDVKRAETAAKSVENFFTTLAYLESKDNKPDALIMFHVGLKLGGRGTVADLFHSFPTNTTYGIDQKLVLEF